jgi:hypothetical protein
MKKVRTKLGIAALILAIILYLTIGLQNYLDKDYPHAFVWASYALANVGFLWYEFVKKTVE